MIEAEKTERMKTKASARNKYTFIRNVQNSYSIHVYNIYLKENNERLKNIRETKKLMIASP